MVKMMGLCIAAVLFLSACGVTEPTENRVPAAVTDRLAALQQRIEVLEADTAAEAERADRAVRRLGDALSRLRKELGRVSTVSGDAAEAAEQALAEVRAAAGELAVLSDRYDYHLRRYHGGG